MEKRSRRRTRDLVTQAASQGLSQNEIGCARISMMARSTNAPCKGRIQMRKTNPLHLFTFGQTRTSFLGGRTSASAECRHWSGRAVRWSSCAILLRLGCRAHSRIRRRRQCNGAIEGTADQACGSGPSQSGPDSDFPRCPLSRCYRRQSGRRTRANRGAPIYVSPPWMPSFNRRCGPNLPPAFGH